MLREFILWLDEYLHSHGSPAIAKAVLGLMSFAVLIGAIFSTSLTVRAGALTSAIFVVVSLGLILLADRRSIRQDLELNKSLLSHYCRLIDNKRPAYQVLTWEQTCTINTRGDAQDTIKVRAKVLTTDLWFIRFGFGCGWPQSPRYRSRVRMSVRNLHVGDNPGVSIPKTSSWIGDGKLDLIVHFPTPPAEDSEISFIIEQSWPGRCTPLIVNKVPDEFGLKFMHPVAYASYKIILPPRFDAFYEPVGFDARGKNFHAGLGKVEGTQTAFVLEVCDLPVRHRVAARLELKENSAAATGTERYFLNHERQP